MAFQGQVPHLQPALTPHGTHASVVPQQYTPVFNVGKGQARDAVSLTHKGHGHMLAPPLKIATPQGKGGIVQSGKTAPRQQGGFISASGCTSPAVAEIINGSFQAVETNHGKPVYRKPATANSVAVLIYYWDERDGPNFSGWWFGPKVGGDQVWAYNSSKGSLLPPATGWKVPWDGPVDDGFLLTQGPPLVSSQPQWASQGAQEAARQQQIAHFHLKREEQQKLQRERAEEMAKKQAELVAKRQEDEIRRQEQNAALAVRKIIQRVRTATPDTYDELRLELETTQTSQLQWMGSQAEKVLQEAEKALQQAQERVDQIAEKRNVEERKKLEEEMRVKEEANRVESLTQEAADEVSDVESKVASADELAKSLTPSGEELTPEEILDIVQQTSEALTTARDLLEAVSNKITDKKSALGSSEVALAKLSGEFREFYKRLSVCRRSVESLGAVLRENKQRAFRRRSALKRKACMLEEFERFAGDREGHIKRREITKLSLDVFNFFITEEHLNRIDRSQVPTPLGVPFDRYQRLRTMVAVARSEVNYRKRAAEEQELERRREEEAATRREELREKREVIQKLVDGALETLSNADDATSKAEDVVKALDSPDVGDFTSDTLADVTDKGDCALAEATSILDHVLENAGDVEKDCDPDEDLKSFQQEECARLRSEAGYIRSRLDRVQKTLKSGKDLAAHKSFFEMETLGNMVIVALRSLMTEEGKTGEDMFEQIGEGSDLTSDRFVSFLKTLPNASVEDVKGAQYFLHLADGQETISKDKFLESIRLYYRVVNPTVLTETMSIKSKTSRRLEIGEVVEGIEGPKKDDKVELVRVHCRCVSDGDTGWVTIEGNRGALFLEPGGKFYHVVQTTQLTDGFASGSKVLRELVKGEFIEIQEFQKKEASTGCLRIKGKTKNDGLFGWATVAQKNGARFLEVC